MNLISAPLPEVLKMVNPKWVKLRDSILLGYQVPTQRQLENLIIDLLPALNAIAQDGQIFGAWSLETIFLDEEYRAHLLPGYAMPLQKQYDPDSLFPGFAALEQYTDHPSYPLGPHTDVYGLAMILRTVILRIAPTPAIDRLNIDIESMTNLDPPGFSRAFLRTLDHASTLQFTNRIANIQEWAQMLNLIGPAPGELIDRLHASYVHLLKQQRILLEQHMSARPQFFNPGSAQAQRARSYSAAQAPTFSTPYQAHQSTGLMVGRHEHVIKDISPSAESTENAKSAANDKEQADKQWAQQSKRSASMVPVTSQNKTTGRPVKKAAPPPPKRRIGLGIPLMAASLLAAATTLYFVLYDQTPSLESPSLTQTTPSTSPRSPAASTGATTPPSPAPNIRSPEILTSSQAEQQALARALEQKHQQEQAAAQELERQRQALIRSEQERALAAQQRQQEQEAAEQREREQRALAQQRQREQEAAAQREREQRALAQQRQREQLALTQQREQAAAAQRQRDLAAAEQRQRTQTAATSQREQELERTLRTIERRPAEPAPSTSPQAPTARAATPPVASASTNVGTVRFNIRPWGNVTINGTNHGASPPLTNLRLAPGTYSVRVENGNFPAYTTSVTVRPGQNATVTHGFRR